MITVRRFGLWRTAIGVLAAASLATLAAWAALAPQAASLDLGLPVALAAAVLLGLAISLMRTMPTTLRWDGVAWQAFLPEAPAVPSVTGELDVALDLGAFFLLRLRGRDATGRRRVRWVPVQRRGLEREWHSFRCAVYSPRPGAGRSGDPASRPS